MNQPLDLPGEYHRAAMRKRALILGIGPAQADAIRYLKQAGWWVAGCSCRRAGPGAGLVDELAVADIADVDAVADLARRFGVDRVYSVGSDLAMPTVARVSERLGLPCFVSPATADLLQNKVLLRGFLDERGISPVAHRGVQGAADLQGWDRFPAVLKPSDSQGQRRVYRVDTPAEVADRLDSVLAASRTRTAIVEEHLDGPEVSANVLVVDGAIAVEVVTDRHVVPGLPGGIPQAHVAPTRQASPAALRATQALVEQCVAALGIRSGPVYFQIKLSDHGPRIVEIAPRLDGCHLWRLLREVTGVDLLDATFRLLAGDAPDLVPEPARADTATLRFFLDAPGATFSRARHPASDAGHTEYYLEDGQTVPAVNGVLEKVGYCLEARPHAV
jgi:biotin carboxylase